MSSSFSVRAASLQLARASLFEHLVVGLAIMVQSVCVVANVRTDCFLFEAAGTLRFRVVEAHA